MRSDERIESTRNPKIDFETFIYKNFKDIIASIFIILSILALVLSKDARDSEKVSTLLTTIISASLGFIFGKKVN
jgi:TctA family transporter